VAQLYEFAMLPEHMESPDPSVGPSSITETGALCCSSGTRTGRVPKDKRIVLDDETKDVSLLRDKRYHVGLLSKNYPLTYLTKYYILESPLGRCKHSLHS
jgi:ATP-dependent phosphoenolpyruvate carboxykinase